MLAKVHACAECLDTVTLVKDWRAESPPAAIRAYGAPWTAEGRAVPSGIIPGLSAGVLFGGSEARDPKAVRSHRWALARNPSR